MSGLGWDWPLEDEESLLWQGRPAPRCYIWRNWKLALAATILFLAASFWWILAYQLMLDEGYPWWLQLIPLPLVFLSIWFGPIRILLARIRWEKVFYALTDRRMIIRDGQFSAEMTSFALDEIDAWKQKKYSDQLVSIRLEMKNHPPVILFCLEQPQNLLGHLQRDALKEQIGDEPESV
ncbi:hypothetical protein SAMN02745165_02738 [Malonomonas rubra DSM 5091]|uniref:PH domain-containing protein n=1 Tax=Malonomonas rubra DSM 5091 TaxID=1122189 RepID=A0A1M6KJ49_MALRU|nr:hypothetical protein [Malonomonas rubra]SHJ58955.1 hypothetical protein SAMN02745165_02738 [Malonomonas rubra DSM 5091]